MSSELLGACLLAVRENGALHEYGSVSERGNMIAKAGAHANFDALMWELNIMDAIASRTGASRDLVVAGAISQTGRVPGPLEVGTGLPVATTKDASLVARASTTPDNANAFRCASSWHVLDIKAAARDICCWTTKAGDVWSRI